MDWTTWPISPSFPAMMQELLHFAVAGRLREQAAVVGDPLLDFPQFAGAGLDVTVHTPDGRTETTHRGARRHRRAELDRHRRERRLSRDDRPAPAGLSVRRQRP